MKYLLTTLSIFLFSSFLSAQIALKGKVTDDENQPVQSASVTVSLAGSNIIAAYTFTDKNGLYSLLWKPGTDSLRISVSILGYSKKERIIPAVTSTIDFIVQPRPIELKEVKVKTPPVWQRKDTINYNVTEFKQPQDRVIGDIISRLPGMEVTPGGQIKYNGKPINKFYIEGLDLLEDRYGIANNSIPAESVDKVQVLENYQPVRVLDSIAFSDRAALNIKLKNNAKMKLIGNARVGTGFSPLLNQDELTGLLFKKKYQFINTYKYNNTGTDNTRDLASQNIDEYINAIQNGAIKSDLISLAHPSPPSVNPKRFLFNNAHVISMNQLLPVRRDYQLRINIGYVNDLQRQQSRAVTKLYLPVDTIAITEQVNSHSKLNLLQTDLSLIANTPKYYVKNILKFQGWWSVERDKLTGVNEISQELRNPFFTLSNDFKLLKAKRNYILEWGSYFGYVSLPQKLHVTPGLYEDLLNNNSPYEELLQEASLKTFFTDNSLSLRKKRSKFGSQYKLGFNMQSKRFLSDLLSVQSGMKRLVGDTFQNKLNWQRYDLYNENNWSYENNKWQLIFSLPVNYTMIDYNDTLLKIKNEHRKFFVSPNASAMFQVNPKWSIAVSASFSQDFSEISSITGGYILKNYRSLSNNNAPLGEISSGNISAALTFRDPLKTVFFNTGIVVARTMSNLLFRQEFNGNLETLFALHRNNYTNKINIYGRFSKYMIDWKTSMVFNYGYTSGKQQQVQQNESVVFFNQFFTAGMAIGTKLFSKITVDYSGTVFLYLSKSQFQQTASAIRSVNQSISINYYPTPKLILRASAEHYYTDNNIAASSNYYFADISMRYKPGKSKIDYEVICQNLFNTRSFTTAYLSNNIEAVSEYNLRPRQLLFKMNFSF